MLHRAALDHDLDLGGSFVISDRFQDLAMGFAVGARGILVLSGYGKGEYLYHGNSWPRQPDFVAQDLLEGMGWILGQAG
jgi:D-glycero-D-manno-heptose 1,7-bisphosphate phosphatase